MAIEVMTIDVNGHALVLSAERAAFDPALRSIFVADVHLGKDAVFRARGIPVPVGSTHEMLARFDQLIVAHCPTSIVFLGDLLHARESHSEEVLNALRAWRSKHRAMRLVLVQGNHDRHAGALPDDLEIEQVAEPFRFGPWALCHHPQVCDCGFVLAGHEHPVFRVATPVDRVRLPCFRFGPRSGVLPAFGAFTGGFEVNERAPGEAIYVTAQERIFKAPR
jgi:DNA ligase-associated metallophosphoesterase